MTKTDSELGNGVRPSGLATRLAVRPYPDLRLDDIDLTGLPRTTAIERAFWLPVRLQLAYVVEKLGLKKPIFP